jgi:hypothetical protein
VKIARCQIPRGRHNPAMRAAFFLICSNIFMTFAWYGHLKWFPKHAGNQSLFPFKIIVLSWAIAFFEYCFQVPGNRIGQQLEGMTLGQLKIMQEVITLTVFTVFAITFGGDRLSWRYFVACGLIAAAAVVIFTGKKSVMLSQ